MVNFIHWGEIYRHSWFGDFEYNTRSIPYFGSPSGFFTGRTKGTDAFQSRVTADGGVHESTTCIKPI